MLLELGTASCWADLGKTIQWTEISWFTWPSFKNHTHSREVTAGTPMSKQKHSFPDLEDTACSSLNLCSVLQCSALLPWQKSPHSNNLFQGRLKRDSAHAQKAALVLLAVCSGHFKETTTKTRERSGTAIFFLCWRGWLFSYKEDHAHVSVLGYAAERETTLESCHDYSSQTANSRRITERQLLDVAWGNSCT